MRVRAASMAVLLASCGSAQEVNPGAPVTLVLGANWSSEQRQVAANVAESWNLEFGTQLEVGPPRPASRTVAITFDEAGCTSSLDTKILGRGDPWDATVVLCPMIAPRQGWFYDVLRHELGHVLGILKHTPRGTNSVMSTGLDFPHSFRLLDQQRFHEVHPEWVGLGGCNVVRRPEAQEDGAGAVDLVRGTDGQPYMVWTMGNGFQYMPASPLGEPFGEPGFVATNEPPVALEAHTAPDGFSVTWLESDGLHYSRIKLPDLSASEPQLLAVATDAIGALSVAHAGPSTWLAVNHPGLVAVQVIGKQGAGQQLTVEASGRVIAAQDRAFLLSAEGDGTNTVLKIGELGATGDRVQLLHRNSLISLPEDAALRGVAPAKGGFLAALSSGGGKLELLRVDGVAAQITSQVEISAVGLLEAPVAMVETPRDIRLVALMQHSDHDAAELYEISLDQQSLAVQWPWRRLSSPDGLAASAPRVALTPEHLLVAWNEAKGDVRSRCVPLDH